MAICEQCQQVVKDLGKGGKFSLPDRSFVAVKDGIHSPCETQDGVTHYLVVADKRGPFMEGDQSRVEDIFFITQYSILLAHLLLGLNRIE